MQLSPIHTIFNGINFSKRENHILKNNVRERFVQKGDVLFDPMQREPYLYFVLSGCLRTFFTDSSGKEHTLQFTLKDCWITDFIFSFKNDSPLLRMDCLQNAVLYELSGEGLEELCSRIPKLRRYFITAFEKSQSNYQKRIMSAMVQSARERYLRFTYAYPDIYESIRSYYVASYLGISPEALSRIKRKLVS